MNRKVQHLLTASASVLAIGAGAMVAQAAGPGTAKYENGAGSWARNYVLTDTDAATTPADTAETGVTDSNTTATATASVTGHATGAMQFGGEVLGASVPSLTNGGSFTVKAGAVSAPATGPATATATINAAQSPLSPVGTNGAGAIVQNYKAGGTGKLDVILNNSGKLGVVADAQATSTNAAGTATSSLDKGIVQNALAGLASISDTSAIVSDTAKGDVAVTFHNTAGTTTVASQAVATGATVAIATSTLGAGITQTATNNGSASASASTAVYSPVATAALNNAKGATVAVGTVATANATTSGNAVASGTLSNGITQTATASDSTAGVGLVTTGTVGLTNAGTLNVGSVVTAKAAAGTATATANGTTAVTQSASGKNANVTLTNTADGVVAFANTAKAEGKGASTANAGITGVNQTATATGGTIATDLTGVAKVTFANAGKFDVAGVASAVAGTAAAAVATATAVGVKQLANGLSSSGVASFDNSGTFAVTAQADAKSSAAAPATTAKATAVGLDAKTSGASAVSVKNSKDFTVTANANGTASVSATAVGIEVTGGNTAGTKNTKVDVVNSGTINVTASAIDTNATASVAGVGAANAWGVTLTGSVPNASVVNSGTIMSSAVTNYADLSTATGPAAVGIFVGATTPSSTPTTDLITIANNGGTIIARESNDGGKTWKWGDAINTRAAVTPVAINLNGAGDKAGVIYGDVNVQAKDVITVANGETQLNGRVNGDAAKNGSLVIKKGGTLYLQDAREGKFGTAGNYNGPSQVYVDSFTNAGGGVLAIEAPNFNSTGTGEVVYAGYPQVFANKADITGGVLEIRPSSMSDGTGTGLYANSYVLNDVIVSSTPIVGDLAAVNTRSVLLTAKAHKDNLIDAAQSAPTSAVTNTTLDVEINRVAFNAVGGLDRNETSVATAIESDYAATLTGPNNSYSSVVADLFKIDDAVKYASALEQLAATQYAGYLRSSTMAGARFNSLIYDMAECGKGSITNELCRSENGGPRLWITGNYGRVSTDGDNEAAGLKAEQYWIAAGLDFAVSPNFVLGVAGGYLENSNKFKANEYDYKGGDRIKSKGWQAGIYGNYDSGKFYVKGAVSYSDLDGNARRNVNLAGLGANYAGAPQLVTGGLITGDADVNVWAAGAEAGVRFPLGENATITPYASLDYAHAKMKRFDEQSSDATAQGALLSVRGSDEFFASELGLELAAQWGNVSPYIRGGWQHNFGDKRAKFTGEFINSPVGSSFDVVSERFAPDAGVVEVGLAAQFSPNFNAHLGYQGRFSKNVEEHTGGLTLSYLFGGAEPVAPPPPPAPVTPPPPPPPPPQVVCNKGPYIVFFDFDKSDITPEAATVLDSAVTAYGNCDVVPIMLAGYTDRAGTPRYNMGLSARRNTSVQGYLTSRGIPGDRISAQAFGESNPRVPTADGVRELQNRRVEITYGPGSGN